LDEDTAVQEEARNTVRAVIASVGEMRAGRLVQPDKHLKSPRPK
jgi:hypothetical protein